jgi:hypothetical protein
MEIKTAAIRHLIIFTRLKIPFGRPKQKTTRTSNFVRMEEERNGSWDRFKKKQRTPLATPCLQDNNTVDFKVIR